MNRPRSIVVNMGQGPVEIIQWDGERILIPPGESAIVEIAEIRTNGQRTRISVDPFEEGQFDE